MKTGNGIVIFDMKSNVIRTSFTPSADSIRKKAMKRVKEWGGISDSTNKTKKLRSLGRKP